MWNWMTESTALVATHNDNRNQHYIFTFLSFGILLASTIAIYKLTQEMDYAKFKLTLTALSSSQFWLTTFLSLTSYLVLSGYDWSAIRYLGRKLPLTTIVFASFCGCAFANTLGLNLLSGASVRYHIYGRAGLGGIDVGAIALFGMIAFGSCVCLVGAIGLVAYPDLFSAFFHITASYLRLFGLLFLFWFSYLVYLTFTKQTPIQLWRWRFRLPSGPITLAQIVLSLLETFLAGGCLYLLIDNDSIPFISFLAVYSVAVAAGIASHLPGGIGVFETVILLAFKNLVSPEALAAALLIYRLIYNLLPLVLATLLLAIREYWERNIGATTANDSIG
jgi:phosphatidylglycerol lysyltransferase